MAKKSVKEIFRQGEALLGEIWQLEGWVRTIRVSKEWGFIELNDGSFFSNLQVVFDKSLSNYEEICKLGAGSALAVSGRLEASPGKEQPFELQAKEITVLQACPSDYPLQKKRHSPEYLRTIAHLRPRTNLYGAIFRLRSVMAYAIHRFFQERDFIYVQTPVITGSDAEGAGAMFHVTADKENFFGKETNLTVSGQLNAESFSLAYKNVYTFGPAFRAEDSNTPRHAAEFWMIEPEISFAGLEEVQDLAEEMVKYLIHNALQRCPEEMQFFFQRVDKDLWDKLRRVRQEPFARITYTEGIELLQKARTDFRYPVVWGMDLQTEHERYLTEQVFSKPVFVTDYPREIKAFYMRNNDDGKTVAAMDLLVPGVGEIIGGSQREERLDRLTARIKEAGMKEEDYWWYLELRKYGSVRHGGFGLGFERLLMYLSGVSNIRDVIPFPRTAHWAEF